MTYLNLGFGILFWDLALTGVYDFYRWMRIYRAVRRIRRDGHLPLFMARESHYSRTTGSDPKVLDTCYVCGKSLSAMPHTPWGETWCRLVPLPKLIF